MAPQQSRVLSDNINRFPARPSERGLAIPKEIKIKPCAMAHQAKLGVERRMNGGARHDVVVSAKERGSRLIEHEGVARRTIIIALRMGTDCRPADAPGRATRRQLLAKRGPLVRPAVSNFSQASRRPQPLGVLPAFFRRRGLIYNHELKPSTVGPEILNQRLDAGRKLAGAVSCDDTNRSYLRRHLPRPGPAQLTQYLPLADQQPLPRQRIENWPTPILRAAAARTQSLELR